MIRATLPVVLLAAAAWLSGCASSDGGPGVAEGQQLLEDGRDQARRNNHPEAVRLFTSALKANPDLAEAWYERGRSNVAIRLDPKTEGESRAFEQRAMDDFSMAI